MIYSERGGGGLTAHSLQSPAAKFQSQGDAHMKTNAQIKFLYYPLKRYTEKHMNAFFSSWKLLKPVELVVNKLKKTIFKNN